MTQSRNLGQEVQAEIVKTVRRGQEVVVEAIKTWTDQVRMIAPPVPEVSLPFADKLPRPEELLGNAYDLAGKLLAGQRKFAEDVLQAAVPLLPGYGDTAPEKSGGHSAGQTGATQTKNGTPKTSTAKTRTAKPSTAKTSTAKNGTASKTGRPAR
jgi:hypothetical protein